MNVHIKFPSLGVTITPKTTQAEIDALCASHPAIKGVIERLNPQTGNGKGKETK